MLLGGQAQILPRWCFSWSPDLVWPENGVKLLGIISWAYILLSGPAPLFKYQQGMNSTSNKLISHIYGEDTWPWRLVLETINICPTLVILTRRTYEVGHKKIAGQQYPSSGKLPKFFNFFIDVQLIFSPRWPVNQWHNNKKIVKLQIFHYLPYRQNIPWGVFV